MTIRYREAIGDIRKSVDEYVSSLPYDKEILVFVVKILKAHVEALVKERNIPPESAQKIVEALSRLEKQPEDIIEYSMKHRFEDIHEALESLLHDMIGEEAGYAPLGRSRNDHVSAAIRLKTASESIEITKSLLRLRKTLIEKAGKNLRTIFVTHTHFQPAQTTTFAHYLLSLEEELSDLTELMLNDVEKFFLKSPLGAAAGSGTCARIPRTYLAEKLGFKDVIRGPLYATGSRVFLQRFLSDILLISSSLERVLNDIFLFSNPSLNLIKIPSRHIQTSSLMPHKRNPATIEVVRARLSEIRGLLLSANIIESRLPTGYSLDLQEETPLAWRSSYIMKNAIEMLDDVFKDMAVNENAVSEYISRHISGITELVELVSLESKRPFRAIYREVAKELSMHSWDVVKAVIFFAKKYGIDETILKRVIEPYGQVECKVTAGSFEEAEKMLGKAVKTLEKHRNKLEELEHSIQV